MKHITITPPSNIEVVPFGSDEDNGKQIAITIPDSAEIIYYPMTRELVQELRKDMGMNNTALRSKREEQIRKIQARAQLAGAADGNGGAQSPEEAAIARELLQGKGRRPQ